MRVPGISQFSAMLDPEEVYAEAGGYDLECEPVEQELPAGLEREDLEDLFHEALEGRARSLPR